MNNNSMITRSSCRRCPHSSAPALPLAEQPNFSGTWKLNLGKSQLSGTAYTFDKKLSGVRHHSGGGSMPSSI